MLYKQKTVEQICSTVFLFIPHLIPTDRAYLFTLSAAFPVFAFRATPSSKPFPLGGFNKRLICKPSFPTGPSKG